MQIKKVKVFKSANKMARQERNRTDSSESSGVEGERPHSRRERVHEHNIETIANGLLNLGNTIWLQFEKLLNYVGVDLGGYQMLDKIAQWCVRNPCLAIFMLLGFCFFIFPFMIIVFFGITAVFMTLFGFLVVEGTLLTFVSMVLFGCVGVLALILSFLIIIGVVCYFGFSRIYDICDGFERQKAFVRSYLQNNINGTHAHNNAT